MLTRTERRVLAEIEAREGLKGLARTPRLGRRWRLAMAVSGTLCGAALVVASFATHELLAVAGLALMGGALSLGAPVIGAVRLSVPRRRRRDGPGAIGTSRRRFRSSKR